MNKSLLVHPQQCAIYAQSHRDLIDQEKKEQLSQIDHSAVGPTPETVLSLNEAFIELGSLYH